MGHFVKVGFPKFVAAMVTSPLLAVMETLSASSELINNTIQGKETEWMPKSSEYYDEQQKGETHPIDIAIQALELYRSGKWDKEKAMRVVKEALGEYKNPENKAKWEAKPIKLPSLPGAKVHVKIEDVDLINQLFS